MASADELYALAMNAGHPYHRDKALAQSLALRAAKMLLLPLAIENALALKLTVSYILFTQQLPTFDHCHATGIMAFLRFYIEKASTAIPYAVQTTLDMESKSMWNWRGLCELCTNSGISPSTKLR
jgi:hypothetical protein